MLKRYVSFARFVRESWMISKSRSNVRSSAIEPEVILSPRVANGDKRSMRFATREEDSDIAALDRSILFVLPSSLVRPLNNARGSQLFQSSWCDR